MPGAVRGSLSLCVSGPAPEDLCKSLAREHFPASWGVIQRFGCFAPDVAVSIEDAIAHIRALSFDPAHEAAVLGGTAEQ
jgi:hypothetical protein